MNQLKADGGQETNTKTRQVLRVWHLSALAIVPILYAIFRNNSETSDESRSLVDLVTLVAATGWGAISFVYSLSLVSGESRKLIELYRSLTAKTQFLVLSSLLLSMVAVFLLCELLLYRQVHFVVPSDAVIYLNDVPGDLKRLGPVKANTPTPYLVRVGERKIVVRDATSQAWLAGKKIIVAPVFSKFGRLEESIDVDKRQFRPL